MAITITIDNDSGTAGIQTLVNDQSANVQTPLTADTGNDSDLGITDATVAVGNTPDSNNFDGTLTGANYSAAFLSFLNAATIFGSGGLRLTDAQKAFAANVEGAVSSSTFVSVTTSAGETINDLFFSDSAGNALNGQQVTGMHTLDGGNVYLYSNGDYAIATTSATAGAGRVVAAFYLNEAADHHSAQVQMATFEPLQHPLTDNPDDALNFTDLLQVSAAGTLSFNFDNLPSGNFLYAAVGSTAAGIMVTGRDLNVQPQGASKAGDIITGGNGGDPSDTVNTSQGGLGATIGIDNQMFAAGKSSDGPTGVFTLIKGFTSFDSTTNGTSEGTGGNITEIGYSDYINAPSASIFISQISGSTATFRLSLWEAGGGGVDKAPNQLTPETSYNYLGDHTTDSALNDDWAVNVGSISVTRGNTTYTWGTGGIAFGTAQGGINVTLDATHPNAVSFTGIQAHDAISFAAANDPNSSVDGTFNRFDIQALAGSDGFDVGRIDLSQGVSVAHGVGSDLVVQDDGPTMVADPTNAPSITDDESALGTDNTGDFSGNFTATFGTDGPGATPKTYALSTAGGDSGLIESGSGLHIFLFKVGNNIVGKSGTDATAAASGTTDFVISVNSSGVVTLDQQHAVVHDPDSGTNQSTTFSSAGLVVLTATANDGDGDQASDHLDIAQLLNFADDAPTITSQILDGEVAFTQNASVSHSLNGAIGTDGTSSTQTSFSSGTAEYTISYWDTTPTNVYPNLNAVLSNNGTVLTYYSDIADTNPVYRLTLDPLANSGHGGYTFQVLQPPPVVSTNFGFTDLPSGQNLDGVIATDKADLSKGGLLVFPSNPVLNPDGTFTNTSGTINTSKGGGPVTIGNTNQAFDNPSEGAYFMYVDNPAASSVGGLGLTQTSADDADTIRFNGLNQSTDSSVSIVQASGAGTAKRPGPAIQIHAFEADANTAVSTDADARALVTNPVTATGATEVDITGIKIHDSTGAVIEYRTVNQSAGGANFGDLHGADSAVGIQFVLIDAHGAGTADDVYSAVVSNLQAGYTIEFMTASSHNIALVQNVSGSFDIGGFSASNQVTVPAQTFHFAATITDYDNDAYGGHLATFADWNVTIDSVVP